MKKIVILIAIFILALGIMVNDAYAATGTTNVSTTRLREAANSDSKTLTLIPIKEEVEIIEKTGEWYKVKYNEYEGYIFAELLDVTGEVPQTGTPNETPVIPETPQTPPTEEQPSTENKNPLETLPANMKAKAQINVKITPLINSSNIGKIDIEKEVTVTEVINDWCYIVSENASGWTRTANLEQIVEEPIVDVPSEPSEDNQVSNDIDVETKIGYVNATSLYVRDGATTDAQIIHTINRNEEVEITEELDGWYAVNIGEIKGYVASKYISDTKVETTSRGSNESREPIVSEEKVESVENTQTETVDAPVVKPTEETVTEPEETVSEIEQKPADKEPEQIEQTTNDLGAQIVEYAKKYLGYKYVSGGTTPSGGFDCSGFTQYVYAHFGIEISRSSKTQAKDGNYIDKEDLQLGDLIIFNNTSNSAVGHTGIYVGNNNFIHAANAKKGVIITSLSDSYYKARYVSSRRVF